MRSTSTAAVLVMVYVAATLCSLVANEIRQVEQIYEVSNAVVINPERGLYKQFTASAEGRPLALHRLESLRSDGMTLLLRLYYLDTFRDRDLNEKQLRLIEQDFGTIRQAGCKCILRFAYCSKIGQSDAPLETVLRHIEQLQPSLQENADVMAVMQAGFIGPWGEWHNSTNNLETPEAVRAIANGLLSALPPTRVVQIRTPRYKRTIVGSDSFVQASGAFLNEPIARLGHHNDCFLADETDIGTYESEKTEWDKNYVAQDTRYLPIGGETCLPSAFTSVANARQEMKRLHWSYLNLGFHPGVLDDWERAGFLDEVKRLLGYRIALHSSRCAAEATTGGTWNGMLRLENLGWAAPFNPRDVIVAFKSQKTAAEFRAKVPIDPRRWLPGENITVETSVGIPDSMSAGNYRVHFYLPDPEPRLRGRAEYAIQLANEGLWDAKTGMHDLRQDVLISNGPPQKKYMGRQWLEEIQPRN